MESMQISRRQFNKIGLSSGLALSGKYVSAQSGYDIKKYQGVTISVIWPNDYLPISLGKVMLNEFTQSTGIAIELHESPYVKIKDIALSENKKDSSDYDLMFYLAPWKRELSSTQCLAELGPYFKNPSILDPNYDFNDLIPGFIINSGLVGGRKGYLEGQNTKIYGIPRGAETSIFSFKKSSFSKFDIKPPIDYTEFKKVLRDLHSKSKQPAMTARFKKGHHCVHSWLLHLSPMGGQVFDDKWKPSFNQKAGVEALDFCQTIIENGNHNITDYDFSQNINEFINGESSIYLDSSAIISVLMQPDKERIQSNIGFSLHPRGSRYASAIGGFAVGIMDKSKNKDAAFIFLQWLTNKEQDIKFMRKGATPSRRSTLVNRELLREIPYFEVFQKQLVMAYPDWRPIFPEWDEINVNQLGQYLHQAMIGQKNSKAALDECANGVEDLMKKWGYIK